jgi:glycogen synthase
MAADYSWNHSAKEYLRLYQSLVTTGHPAAEPLLA